MGDSPPLPQKQNNDDDTPLRAAVPVPLKIENPLLADNWADYIPTTDHVRFFRGTDWGRTRMGPLKTWSMPLRLQVFMVLADSRPACLYWGPQKVAVYNVEFAPLAGKTHPRLMGATFEEIYPELWDQIGPVFAAAARDGVSHDVKEMQMFVERMGFVEETYFTGNFTPVRDETGKVAGFYNAVHEITRLKIGERWREMLQKMQVPILSDERRLADHVMPPLASNLADVPMALLYKIDEETIPGTPCCVLRGRIGVPDGHPLAAETALLTSGDGIMPLLRKARENIITVQVDKMFDGLDWKGFGDPCKFVSILPILVTARLWGFLVIGANPRRPVDDDYHQYIRDLSSHLSSIAASILTASEIRKREESLQKQITDQRGRMMFMAQHAVIGMSYLYPDGRIAWANEHYYEITGQPPGEESKLAFLDTFLEEDQPKATKAWNNVIEGQAQLSVELRLKRDFMPPSGEPEPAVVRCQHIPLVTNKTLQSVMTFTTDVSAFKWAESAEARRADQANEDKRQQEEFIDFISHELRNPLSAIFQLAETIITSYPSAEGNEASSAELSLVLKQNIDHANTILMCAKHQKRIVDDVLTLSKMEYTMLSVSPLPVQLPVLIQKWMKMLETQISSSDIQISVHAQPSLKAIGMEWILCDELRIHQIWLNLVQNAIKFTKSEMKREIRVEYGAVLKDPELSFSNQIQWARDQRELKDLTLNPEWGFGQQLYLTFSVTDTGIGMTDKEIKRVFRRFEQASAKTSTKYGGSGLGLFLCQRLAERQAGAIGVSSEPGKGSTFAFYVKSRRAESPTQEVPLRTITNHPPAPLRSISHPATSLSVPALDLNKIHVLLVEDNVINQRVVLPQLKKAGCVVYIANHGVEALEIIRESDLWHENVGKKDTKHLDIILMDWEMPIMDGLACSREIRKLHREGKITRHVEILATTANARDEQVKIALASGIDDVVSKPFLVSDLLVRIRERLSLPERRTVLERAVTGP